MTSQSTTRVPAMTASRTIGAYLTEARYELVRLLRTPAFSVPVLAMPLFMYLFFGVLVMGASGDATLANHTFVVWTVYGVMGPGLFGFGIVVAVERGQGLLTFKRALPMPPGAYLTAKILMALAFAMIVMTMFVIAGVLVGGVSLGAPELVRLVATMGVGVAPACAVGFLIGAWAPASSAPAIANIAYLSMALLSGLLVPLTGILAMLQPLWPTHHLVQMAFAAAGLPSQGSIWIHVLILAVVTLVLSALAGRRLARNG